MSYDNKDIYPSPSKLQNPESSGSANIEEGDLTTRALEYLKTCLIDMQTLQTDRAALDKAYKAQEQGDEAEGRSKVVMSDVQDTVESLMPSLMRIFYGGTDVLNIKPQGLEDEQKAKLMEEKVNFDIQKGLNGFKLLYTFIKDALLFKLGVIKYYWLNEKKYTKREWKNLTHEEYLLVSQKPRYQINEVVNRMQGKIVPAEMMGMIDPMSAMSMTHDVVGREIEIISKPTAENLPPEEFIFDVHQKFIGDTFCAHKKRVHRKKLLKYGLSEDDIKNEVNRFSGSGIDDAQIVNQRFSDLGGLAFLQDPKDKNFVYIYECYLSDYDEEGNEQPKIVTIYGCKSIKTEDNTFDKPPFVVASPVMISHRIVGRSIAELVVELQKIHTALVRYVLDNIYYQNNAIQVVNPFRIDVDSLLNGNRPGGKIYTKYDIDPSSAIMPIPTNPLPAHIMDIMEYVSTIKENRTGVTKYNQGLDSKTLNKTASGISQIMSASQQRIELIARIFSETGIKDLFEAFVDMNVKFFDREQAIKVNQEWVMINPEDINGKFDVVIDVGIGTGSKEMAFQQKVQMLNMYGAIAGIAGPMTPQIFSIENIKNILRAMWEDQGYRNTGMYLSPDMPQGDPNGQPTQGIPGQPGVAGTGGGSPPQQPSVEEVLSGLSGQGGTPAMGMPIQ